LKNFWVGHYLGKGSFRWLRYPGGTSDRLSVSDLDADGLPELIFLLPGQRRVSILRNRGTGISVNSPVFVTTVDLPSSVAAGDLDGDGDLDLATTEVEGNYSTRGSVSLLLNRTPPPLSRDQDHDGIPDECARAVFHRGDPSGDGGTDLSDAVSLLDFLFTAGPAPGCLESADADNDGQVDLSDPIALLNFLFLAGAPPAPPGPAPLPCGPDPDSQGSPGDRGCRTYAACRA
jgi:hypothetical protein